jgi:hypothetical protein
MGINRSVRGALAGVVTALLACQLLTAQPAEAVVTAQSRTIQGSDSDTQQKEWFNREFDTQERFFGKLRGRIRFVTDTTATLSTTRTVTSTDRGTLNAGQALSASIGNSPVASRLHVTARPALQLILEYQPQGDSYVCNNTTFPTFSGDDWFMRTDGGGPVANGMCGAIEVTADDLNLILDDFGIDIGLPEVFNVMDEFFTAGFSGTQNLDESHHLFDIPVCQIATQAFGLPIGDHCDIEVNAEVAAGLTTLGHTLDAQLCTDGGLNGTSIDCLLPFGDKRSITFASNGAQFSVKAPCPTVNREVDVRITDPAWNARLDQLDVSASLDFNVHLSRFGDGVDVLNIPVGGSRSLLNTAMPLNVTYPASDDFVLHVAKVTPDDDAPSASLNPAAVTIDEGSSTTFTALTADLCTKPGDLTTAWSIDGFNLSGPTLTRTYNNNLPNAVHNGTLRVTDEAGNQAPAVPFSVTVRNVPPQVQLAGLPSNPIPRGTTLNLATQVADPGADIETWNWSFGDGINQSRTANSVSDRTDSRNHTYVSEGLYSLQVGVHDGTAQTSAGGLVTVFDRFDRLNGSGTFTADSTSINVPVGSSYSAHANVAYANGAVRPSGSFISDFLIDIGSGESVSKHLVATSYEWLFESGQVAKVQGFATVDGESGWKFQAEVTNQLLGLRTNRMTVAVWRPGVTSLADPDYRFGGPRSTGNIHK